jgi:hypothetical protein
MIYSTWCDPAFPLVGWDRVRGNKGARTAGTDGQTVASIQARVGVEEFLAGLRTTLKGGVFRPLPVRERMIPKPGTAKRRRLGIPTVADRVVQASLKLVLEPIFEADSSRVPTAFARTGARTTRCLKLASADRRLGGFALASCAVPRVGLRPTGSGQVGPKRPHARPECRSAASGPRSGTPLKTWRESSPIGVWLDHRSGGADSPAPRDHSKHLIARSSASKPGHVFGTITRHEPMTAGHSRT